MSALAMSALILVILTAIPAVFFAWNYRPMSANRGEIALNVAVGTVLAFFVPCLGSFTWSLIPAGLLITTCICSMREVTPRVGRRWIGATSLVIDLGFVCWWSTILWQVNHLRQQHPITSLADRLEYERDFRAIKDFGSQRWSFRSSMNGVDLWSIPTSDGIKDGQPMKIEELLAAESDRLKMPRRSLSFESLLYTHRSMEFQFIKSTGFGFQRTYLMHYQDWLIDLPDQKLLPLPPHESELPPNCDFATASPRGADDEPWHLENLVNFVNLPGLGYVDWDWKAKRPDLTRVVGFRHHSFSSQPKPLEVPGNEHIPWRIEDLSLVSLLKHRQGAVYISTNLPNMYELQNVPTRPLEEFEADSISRLRRSGGELVVAADAGHLRMFGSIRAAVQCLTCHQVPRGTLLGAFTYRLSRLNLTVPGKADSASSAPIRALD